MTTMMGAGGCASGKGAIGCASGKGFFSGCTTTPDCGIPCTTGTPGSDAVYVPQCNASAQIVATQFCVTGISNGCYACGDLGYVKVTPGGTLSSVMSGSGTTWTVTAVATASYYPTDDCSGEPTGSSPIDATLTLAVDGDNKLLSGDLVLKTEDGLFTLLDSGAITFGCASPEKAIGSTTLTDGYGCLPGPLVTTVVLCLGYACGTCEQENPADPNFPLCYSAGTTFTITFNSVTALHPAAVPENPGICGNPSSVAQINENSDLVASWLNGVTWVLKASTNTPPQDTVSPSDTFVQCSPPITPESPGHNELASGDTLSTFTNCSFIISANFCIRGYIVGCDGSPRFLGEIVITSMGIGQMFGISSLGTGDLIDIGVLCGSSGCPQFLRINATVSITNNYCHDNGSGTCVSIFDDEEGP